MRFLRCVYAEWLLLLPRFTRTRLGISLLALGATLIWLGNRGLEPLTVALQAGALAAIIGAAGLAGNERDRAARPSVVAGWQPSCCSATAPPWRSSSVWRSPARSRLSVWSTSRVPASCA